MSKNQYEVRHTEKDNPTVINAAASQVSPAGDLVFTDQANQLIFAISAGSWKRVALVRYGPKNPMAPES